MFKASSRQLSEPGALCPAVLGGGNVLMAINDGLAAQARPDGGVTARSCRRRADLGHWPGQLRGRRWWHRSTLSGLATWNRDLQRVAERLRVRLNLAPFDRDSPSPVLREVHMRRLWTLVVGLSLALLGLTFPMISNAQVICISNASPPPELAVYD
jgi:hypothetical protein